MQLMVEEVYINNSSDYYTRRSGGNVGGSTAINTVYIDQSSTWILIGGFSDIESKTSF